jgi:hypothetical protein
MDTKTLRVPSHLHDEAENMLAMGLDTSAVAELRAMASVAAPDLLRAAIVHGLQAIRQLGQSRPLDFDWTELAGQVEEMRPSRVVDMVPWSHGPGSWEAVLEPGERIRHVVLQDHPSNPLSADSCIEVRLLEVGQEDHGDEVLVSQKSRTPALYFREPEAPSGLPIVAPHRLYGEEVPVRITITPPPPWRRGALPSLQLIVEQSSIGPTDCGPLWIDAERGLPPGTPPTPGMSLSPPNGMAPSLVKQITRARFAEAVWDVEHRDGSIFLVQPHDPDCPTCHPTWKDPQGS